MTKDSILYRSGDLFFSEKVRKFLETFIIGSYQTPVYITYWSVLHYVSGIINAYIFLWWGLKNPYVAGFVVHTLWELWQTLIGMAKPWNLTGHNGFVDIVMDTVLYMAGMYTVIGRGKN